MIIEAENLTKTYMMGETLVRALDDASLSIEKGELVAIVGSSGSGKTTLMNLLGCLDRATAGTYRLDDEDVAGLDDDELARLRNRTIGFIFQTFNLITRTTAVENVEIPLLYAGERRKVRARALEALERMGLEERSAHFPNQLSGGENQRVAIARALVNQPSILLADEPTGNLDSTTGAEILAVFEQLNAEGVTTIVVTHDTEVAERCRRRIMLRDGRIIEDTGKT